MNFNIYIIINILILFLSVFNTTNSIIYVLLLSFYYFIMNKNPRKYFNILIISLFIFVLNLSYHDGRVLYRILFLSITENSLFLATKRAGIILLLFLFSSNVIFDNKIIILEKLKKSKSKLIIESLYVFFFMMDNIKLGKDLLNKLLLEVENIIENRNSFITSDVSYVEKNYYKDILLLCMFTLLSIIFNYFFENVLDVFKNIISLFS